MSGEAGRRHINNHGHAVVLKTYAIGGVDDYGDATLTATDGTIKAIREMDARRSGSARDASGAIPVGEAIFYVAQPTTGTILVGTVPTLSTLTVSDGGATQASEFVDDGATFTVIQADKLRSSSGILAVVAERNRA